MANLVFKFSWDHRPFQYNSAQGKRQFMLPFASGIPNLTPDYTQVQGLGNAATGTLTTAKDDSTTGRVLRVGDFGLGDNSSLYTANLPLTAGEVTNLCRRVVGDSTAAHGLPSGTFAMSTFAVGVANSYAIFYPQNVHHDIYCGNLIINSGSSTVKRFFKLLSTANTTTDGNGFVKSASPIVKLFADSIELNDEAKKQPIEFEKIDVGDYLIKASLGFAKEGWYIEMPKDANGNVIVAVSYEQLEDGDISVKTYKKKFDIETASIIPDLDNPVDITESRWIDIRLHEEPEPEPEESVSETPLEFQPTNLSAAVSAAMNNIEPPQTSNETK